MKQHWLPLTLLIVGLFLLIGCIYIPTADKPTYPNAIDFRKLVGQSVDRPIRPGHVDRRTVLLILGKPWIMSKDGSAIAYTLDTQKGILFIPLCFTAAPVTGPTYYIRLDFNSDGILQRYRIITTPTTKVSGMIETSSMNTIKVLNRSGAPLLFAG